jgi:hypothetical protein
MKSKKFHTFESFPKSDRKIAERGTIETSKHEEVISMILNPRVLKCQQLSYLNDRTISPRREVWAQQTSLPLPLFN